MNLVRGWLPHLLPLAWGAVSTLLWRYASKTADWVPITIRGLLHNRKVRAELRQIVADVAGYANLSNAERRQRALEFVRAALLARGISVTDQEIERAVSDPPEDTRAYFRGRCIQRYPGSIAAASWDSIIFDTGQETLQRVPMREPLRGTKLHVEDLLEACDEAAALIDALQR